MEKDHEQYLLRCEELASTAKENGNSAVGSLLVFNNQIVAEAEEAVATKKDITAHAEMEVLKKARKVIGKDMSGAILYSTKEPCIMCSYAIRYHKIEKVVYKEVSGQFGGAHGNYDVLLTKNVPEDWGLPVQCIQMKGK
ncbi:nucleoside deaminase [Muricauda sp. 2012CJ35-5]|uniref:Nucleoside deaminase n=1 Tax=Flagellimonas spongiicola TaxID=2942208 RepID=A0ABT0PV92_9FLAO|nr:nucleoside deaminase [Allomuricauda spongiicola]MCL6274627.1 nucleoside deaminase [Allomuricauda spongiicola]